MLLVLHVVFARTRFGRLVRAATEDREMVGALGVNQSVLFTAVFALGSLLAGLGGALQIAREPANLGMDLTAISDAFVVVVIGGMGSIVGSYIAAVLIAEVKALCIGIGLVQPRRLFREFFQAHAGRRISGDGGRADRAAAGPARPAANRRARRRRHEAPIRPASPTLVVASIARAARLAVPAAARAARQPYVLVLGIDVLIAVLFATSLHFIMGPGGMHSFGHAAYFGLGAYGAALP